MNMVDIFQTIRLNDAEGFYSLIDGIDINILNGDSSNLLHHAITWDRTAIALDLISRGIDLNHPDKFGMTPLQYALQWQRNDIVSAILGGGADVNIRDTYGNNALWIAVFNARGEYEFVRRIIERGGDALTKNKAGRSPLDFARQINDQELIKILATGS